MLYRDRQVETPGLGRSAKGWGRRGSAGTWRSVNAAFRQKGEGRALQMLGRELEGQRPGS